MAYQLAIIGAGVTGAAILHMAARFTDMDKIILIEKNDHAGLLNSHPLNNSQTLHQGDIESNYELDKALVLKYNAALIKQFSLNTARPILGHCQRLLLAVGEKEVNQLQSRYRDFSPHYTHLELWDDRALMQYEPNLLHKDRGFRQEALLAMAVRGDDSIVNYQCLAHALIEDAYKAKKCVEFCFNSEVFNIDRRHHGYMITMKDKTVEAEAVLVCCSGLSFALAQGMGYTHDRWLLSVAGKFFTMPKKTNSKIYTMQNNALPFSAVHCDPCILNSDINRIGPTVALKQYTDTQGKHAFLLNEKVMRLLWPYFKNKETRAFMFKNVLYQWPVVSKHFYLKQARKIIPSLRRHELKEVQSAGIRPLLLDNNSRALPRDTQKINTHRGLIFNIALSPGGVSCLANAIDDVQSICRYLGLNFNQDKFHHAYSLD